MPCCPFPNQRQVLITCNPDQLAAQHQNLPPHQPLYLTCSFLKIRFIQSSTGYLYVFLKTKKTQKNLNMSFKDHCRRTSVAVTTPAIKIDMYVLQLLGSSVEIIWTINRQKQFTDRRYGLMVLSISSPSINTPSCERDCDLISTLIAPRDKKKPLAFRNRLFLQIHKAFELLPMEMKSATESQIYQIYQIS